LLVGVSFCLSFLHEGVDAGIKAGVSDTLIAGVTGSLGTGAGVIDKENS
jgi:hypothetical protein